MKSTRALRAMPAILSSRCALVDPLGRDSQTSSTPHHRETAAANLNSIDSAISRGVAKMPWMRDPSALRGSFRRSRWCWLRKKLLHLVQKAVEFNLVPRLPIFIEVASRGGLGQLSNRLFGILQCGLRLARRPFPILL